MYKMTNENGVGFRTSLKGRESYIPVLAMFWLANEENIYQEIKKLINISHRALSKGFILYKNNFDYIVEINYNRSPYIATVEVAYHKNDGHQQINPNTLSDEDVVKFGTIQVPLVLYKKFLK